MPSLLFHAARSRRPASGPAAWTQERGLASILNFCERVFHDHKMHADEWRAKIGRHIAHGADMVSKRKEGGAPSLPPCCAPLREDLELITLVFIPPAANSYACLLPQGRPSKLYNGSVPQTAALPRVQLEKPPTAKEDEEQSPARWGLAVPALLLRGLLHRWPMPPRPQNTSGVSSSGAADEGHQHLLTVAADLVSGNLQPQEPPPRSQLLITGNSMEDLD